MSSEDASSLHTLESIDSTENQIHNIVPFDNSPENSGIPPQKSKTVDDDSAAQGSTGGTTRRLSAVASVTTFASRVKSSASSKNPHIIPVSERRGLLARFALIPEYDDAREYPQSIKLFIIFIIAFAAITGPMGTSIMLPAIDNVAAELHTSVGTVNVSVGIYLLSLGIFPLWWSALSETLGRRNIYVISFLLFCAFSIGSALSPNIGGLIAFRVLCGGCSASVQAVGAGTVGDLYPPERRGTAMGIYYLGPLMGPFLAPILGGVVAQVWDWRATQWLMVIFSGCNVMLIVFGLPETLRKQDNANLVREMLRQQLDSKNTDHEDDGGQNTDEENNEEQMREKTGVPANITNTVNHELTEDEISRVYTNLSRSRSRTRSIIQYDDEEESPVLDSVMPSLSRLPTNKSSYSRKVVREANKDAMEKILSRMDESEEISWKTKSYDYTIRPLHSLILLSYPPVALVIAFSAVSFCVIYFFNMAISYEYGRKPYHFKEIIVGLLYIPNSVTYVVASILGGKWTDRLLHKYAKAHNGELVPESRLSWNFVLAVGLVPPACLIFGWCLEYEKHWVTPLIGTACYGFASMLIIGASVTYLVDTLPGRGATGVALNNLVRMILAAIATFVVEPALKGIGPGILFSILMGIVCVASGTIYILKKNGQYFRQKYDLGQLYDRL
ncbi:MFS antiporter Qdr3p [[Candida] anglica]|uniref:MFS antiporter Qdr3p n=1 Tax=[Candida] anglica TaxID=148631 RepID=A0ABP0EL32_9ASCO